MGVISLADDAVALRDGEDTKEECTQLRRR